jgi:integrase
LTDKFGRALHRTRFNEVWHAAQERAGITPKRERGERRAPAQQDGCHALRHTAASVWLRAGIDVVRVADWLGDTPQMILQTYAHLMPGDSGDDGRAATEAFFGPQPSAPEVQDDLAR